ncbi:2-deoxy-D-gluconate 3-dehydrogenase [Ruegeria sp. ANG-R]|uniref:SDR family NAD(P)-dependent oxidoreductase n=1 Tax=Ruegeria sp. ANG-R TaxID=1577903 RepID=UPI00057C6B41|nr:SDR family oxidoreductase [Ruegeria sp. ANG-R]KIC39037.1 2-deoxy-D-gluconate 3-dehydrogenase [Ruegeria sp. ANG-R]
MVKKQNNALVTGGTSGLGRAIAQGFHQAGYSVTAVGLGPLPEEDDGLIYKTLDVTDGDAIEALIGGLPTLDVVVNAAGVIRREEELDPDVFTQVVDINLNGTMRVCAAARPVLAKNGGTIINIASMLSYFGGGLVPGYAASKGGIAQLTKSLAIAYAKDGIRVNALAPGWIATPLTQNLQNDPDRSAAILSRTPMARWGKPEDLIGPALFLASEHAGFITGTLLNVDGGYAAV